MIPSSTNCVWTNWRLPGFSRHVAADNQPESFERFAAIAAAWGLEPDDRIVLKKNFLSGGQGIHVLPVRSVHTDLYADWRDVMVQTFCDSSGGIPGLVDGTHDLRVTLVDHAPITTMLRTPATGKLLSNVSQGGTEKWPSLAEIPSEALAMATAIDRRLAHFGNSIYSIDMVSTPYGYKLIELNSRPGFSDRTNFKVKNM